MVQQGNCKCWQCSDAAVPNCIMHFASVLCSLLPCVPSSPVIPLLYFHESCVPFSPVLHLRLYVSSLMLCESKSPNVTHGWPSIVVCVQWLLTNAPGALTPAQLAQACRTYVPQCESLVLLFRAVAASLVLRKDPDDFGFVAGQITSADPYM